MENRITGRSPDRISDEEVDLRENPSAIELCEEVKRLTAETREALLEQALAVSNEKCNALISRLNARVEDLTQQVRSVEWTNDALVTRLKEDVEQLTKDMKEDNRNLLSSLRIMLQRITEIQRQISTTMAKATDEATALLKERIALAADDASEVIDAHAKELTKKVQSLEKEVDKAKEEIYYERGFRKFFFWLTPVLLLAQGIMTAILLLR